MAVLERDSSSSSMLFDRHFYIFNLVNLREVNFDWVNMVREPVARLVSQFHYLRYISSCGTLVLNPAGVLRRRLLHRNGNFVPLAP